MRNTFFVYIQIQVELLVPDYFDLNLRFGFQGTDPSVNASSTDHPGTLSQTLANRMALPTSG